MKNRLELLLLVLVVMGLLAILSSRFKSPTPIAKTTSQPSTAEANHAKLQLYHATLHFCSTKYDKNNCIQSLILCGEECKRLIPRERFARVKADYWKIMNERGLTSQLPSAQKKSSTNGKTVSL